MIPPEVQKLLDYPNTVGKRTTLSVFRWNSLGNVEEVMHPDRIFKLTKEIDKENT